MTSIPNVIHYMHFERLMNAGGPTEGEIIRPSDKEHPRMIAWIQCVDRGDKGLPYCSKVCCMVAAKQTIIAKEHDPSVECTVFYNNMTSDGKGFDDSCQKASSLGVRYIIGRPFDVTEDPETQDVKLRYEDIINRTIVAEEFDLVVLSSGLEPNDRNKPVAEALKIDVDERTGFFTEPDPLFAPLETAMPGVFLCGGAIGPSDMSESVVQATAASMRAVARRARVTEEVLGEAAVHRLHRPTHVVDEPGAGPYEGVPATDESEVGLDVGLSVAKRANRVGSRRPMRARYFASTRSLLELFR